ncbi:phosphatase PAP2 family protein [Paludibaculum fermentans]|uniref:Phosphatase PAP2 family protein n=1 Tax=Paludibaculum fermentans TaxID=1473598 RepID=A0A7S7NRV7_PALFE|nr:phosphatase PAP2 family protein [Paludibaculum fermentans]QOY88685.1 phosphatase PAP2 family protein [Paludibaculum fermentans]
MLVLSPAMIIFGIPGGLFRELRGNPTVAFTYLGCAFLFAAARPGRWAAAAAVGVGGLLYAALDWVGEPKPEYFGSEFINPASYLGVGCLLVLGARVFLVSEAQRWPASRFFAIAWISGWFWVSLGFLRPLNQIMCPLTIDPLFHAVDGQFGFHLSFLLGGILAGRPALWNLTATVYNALPAMAGLALAVDFRDPNSPYRSFQMFVSMGLIGFSLYWFCPAAGPQFAFAADWPRRLPPADSLSAMSLPGYVRNCMPSLHFASALGCYWVLRHARRVYRAVAGVFLLGTFFATLALGEHYQIDLIVAVPFTLTFLAGWVHALPWKAAERRAAVIGGCLLTGLWLGLLRWGGSLLLGSRITVWVLTFVTLGASFFLHKRLMRAIDRSRVGVPAAEVAARPVEEECGCAG